MGNVIADRLVIDSVEVKKAFLDGDPAGEMASSCVRWMNSRENYLRHEENSVGAYCTTNEYMLGLFADGWPEGLMGHVVAAFYQLRKELNKIHDENRAEGVPYIREFVPSVGNQA